jgi:hypothetical protein
LLLISSKIVERFIKYKDNKRLSQQYLKKGENSMKNIAKIMGLGLMIGCSNEAEVMGPSLMKKEHKILKVDDISEFGSEKILIYSGCDVKNDYARALKETVRERGYGKFSLSKQGSLWKGSYRHRDVTVACEDDIDNLEFNYDIVNIRGHTSDMNDLYKEISDHFSEHTTLILGGCNGADFVDDFANENVAVFGGSGTQDTSNGNYLLLQLPKAIEEHNSWESLDGYLAKKSDRFNTEFQSPGRYTK